MPAPSSAAPTIGDALRHLATYNATAATRTTVELTRAAGNLWLDAVTHPRTPLANAARGALWWSTMLDRREPRWHRANTITMSTPFAHLRDFTALARRRAAAGKPLNIASPGAGSAGHLSAVLYQAQAGVNWTHVPYKGGGPAVADLLGGHVDGLLVTLASAVPQIKAGKLVALAVTTPERALICSSR